MLSASHSLTSGVKQIFRSSLELLIRKLIRWNFSKFSYISSFYPLSFISFFVSFVSRENNYAADSLAKFAQHNSSASLYWSHLDIWISLLQKKSSLILLTDSFIRVERKENYLLLMNRCLVTLIWIIQRLRRRHSWGKTVASYVSIGRKVL